MRIGVFGPSSSGKTTFVKNLKNHPLFTNYEFVDETARSAQQNGFPINEKGTYETQLYIMGMVFKSLLIPRNNVIFDRTVVDLYVYSKYLVDKWKKDIIQNEKSTLFDMFNYPIDIFERFIFSNCLDVLINKYDILVKLEREIDIEKDGVRSSDDHFIKTTENLFETVSNFLVKTKNVTTNVEDTSKPLLLNLKGSVEERLSKFIEIYTKRMEIVNKKPKCCCNCSCQ